MPAIDAQGPVVSGRLLVAILLVVIVAGVFAFSKLETKETVKSLAVLPFQNLSPNQADEYLADGVTEELTNALAGWKDFRVTAATSASQFKGKGVDLPEIGRKLNVDAVIEGSFEKQGDRIRITAELNRTSDAFHWWSNTYEAQSQDIMTVQANLANAVAAAVRGLGSVPPAAAHGSTASTEAHDLYLQANYQFALSTPASEMASLDLFHQSVEKDPSYVPAYIGAARTEIGMIPIAPEAPGERFERAKVALQKALDLDPNSAEAHGMLGFLTYNYEWDWPRAEQEYRLALEHGAQSATRTFYGAGLATRGRFREAQEQFQLAEDLDPLGVGPRFHQMLAFYQERNYEEANKVLHGLLDIDPNSLDAHIFLGLIAAIQHNCEEMPVTKFGLAVASACRGDKDRARRYLLEMAAASGTGFVSPYQLALGYAFLHDKEAALSYLQKSLDAREGQILYLKHEPVFDEIQSDPRYVALEKRVGLNPQ